MLVIPTDSYLASKADGMKLNHSGKRGYHFLTIDLPEND